jgi:hypothetical protein
MSHSEGRGGGAPVGRRTAGFLAGVLFAALGVHTAFAQHGQAPAFVDLGGGTTLSAVLTDLPFAVDPGIGPAVTLAFKPSWLSRFAFRGDAAYTDYSVSGDLESLRLGVASSALGIALRVGRGRLAGSAEVLGGGYYAFAGGYEALAGGHGGVSSAGLQGSAGLAADYLITEKMLLRAGVGVTFLFGLYESVTAELVLQRRIPLGGQSRSDRNPGDEPPGDTLPGIPPGEAGPGVVRPLSSLVAVVLPPVDVADTTESRVYSGVISTTVQARLREASFETVTPTNETRPVRASEAREETAEASAAVAGARKAREDAGLAVVVRYEIDGRRLNLDIKVFSVSTGELVAQTQAVGSTGLTAFNFVDDTIVAVVPQLEAVASAASTPSDS